MWCGEDSTRGQCGPCAALLDAIHAAPRAGIASIIGSEWEIDAPRERNEREIEARGQVIR
jgi:hypothetical protein